MGEKLNYHHSTYRTIRGKHQEKYQQMLLSDNIKMLKISFLVHYTTSFCKNSSSQEVFVFVSIPASYLCHIFSKIDTCSIGIWTPFKLGKNVT